MKKISLFVLLLCISYVSTAPADDASAYIQNKVDGEDFRPKWGVADNIAGYKCLASGSDYGWSTNHTNTNTKWQKYLRDNLMDSHGYGKGAMYYVATYMSDKGYKFCKYIFGGGRGDCYSNSWTGYWPADNQDCFWLCEQGYYGEGCESTELTTAKHDLSKDEARKSYIDGKTHGLVITNFTAHGNQENNIPMFLPNQYVSCGSVNRQISMTKMGPKQEHDVVLVAKSMTVSSDKTSIKYTVQPMVVRAAGTAGCLGIKASRAAWAFTQFVAKERTDLCPSDTKYSESVGACIVDESAITSQTEKTEYEAEITKAKSLEEQGLAILCPGFTKEKYDNKVHVLNSEQFLYPNWRTRGTNSSNQTASEYCKDKTGDAYDGCVKAYNNDVIYGDASATCTVFVCKDDSMGYASDPMVYGDFTCVSCTENSDETIHHSRLGRGNDGICKVCKVGEVLKNGACTTAKTIHKFYMNGVYNKATPTKENDIKDQCWTKPTPEEYKSCMEDLGWATYAAAVMGGGSSGGQDSSM